MPEIFTRKFYPMFILILIVFQLSSFAQPQDSLISKVENGLLPVVLIQGEPSFKLADRMAYYKVPGISITVIRNFDIAWSKQYGVMDAELQNPVTDRTMFNVGSLSKGVAALTVLRLVREGKIDLNRNV